MKVKFGNAIIFYEIERYQDMQTLKYLTVSEMDAIFQSGNSDLRINDDEWIEVNYHYHLIPLTIEGSAYFAPGKFYGPPENCYPNESEAELLSVRDASGKDWINDLTDSECDIIIDNLVEEVCNGSSDC